jgi:hypothetical protein
MFGANALILKRWNSQSEGMPTKHVTIILRQNTVRGCRVLYVLAFQPVLRVAYAQEFQQEPRS